MAIEKQEEELTFVPIEPEEFKAKVRSLFHYNMQPLTTSEMLKTGNLLCCPACGKVRYAMSRALVHPGLVFVGQYCTCPEESEGN